MMTEVAASSSSFTYGWPYHVFLSFRGEDTRYNFTGHLYHNLQERGIRTFIDDEGIRKGENITDTLFKVIEESKTAIVVFSEQYASSTFCLKELVHILKCMKGVEGRSIWCVFYHVDPSDVRHQRNSYKDAFDKYEGVMEYKNLVDDWRSALKDAANLCSWHLKLGYEKYEYETIEEIIEAVSEKINDGPLHVAQYPVALESQVEKICSLLYQQLHCDGARMVGICGIGGVGKTTLVRAVYNKIQSQFRQYSCFLSNVREKSIHDLLKTVLSKTIKEKDIGLEYDRGATPIIKDRLKSKKVLLILDDVDKLEQLEILVGEPNWFGAGSIIIITTRNKGLLAKHDIKKIYEVKKLHYLHARKLLTLNVFKEKKVDPKYENVINRAVKYACGLPLALEIIGSNLRGLTVEEWESALDVYERIPHEAIQKVLEVSYYGLGETHKEVFLDIACFYKRGKLGYATYMLQSNYGISPTYCIRVLIDKSLVNIDERGCLRMHDLIQDMGQEIVRRESKLEPGKRSRLWSYQDILHVLKENTGTENIQGIKLDLHHPEEVDWTGEAFEKMKNLRVLIIKGAKFSRGSKCLPNSLRVLDWTNYPSSLPSDFHPINLVILNLSHSLVTLEKPFKRMKNLSVLNLKSCQFISQIPDVSGIPNLRELLLDCCDNLIKIHDSVGYLRKLETLSVSRCARLCTFPHAIKLPSIRNLGLQGCLSLEKFPEILEEIEGIRKLDLQGTNLELPFSIRNLSRLAFLQMGRCQRIQLPSSIVMLPKLEVIAIVECEDLLSFKEDEGQEESRYMMSSNWLKLEVINCNISDEFLPHCFPSFASMWKLDLSDSNFTILPACIKECCSLVYLLLNNCKHLREIATIPPSISKLEAINCYSLSSESRDILLSQELHELQHRKFCMPAGRIPEWFEQRRSGPSISFWYYYKSPRIYLCLSTPDEKCDTLDCLSVDTRVNRKRIPYNLLSFSFGKVPIPPRLFEVRDHMFVDAFVVPQHFPNRKWNHVEICANFGKEIGIHVNKQLGNNIRFADPYNRFGKEIDEMDLDDYSSPSARSASLSHEEQEAVFVEECGELLSFRQVWSKVVSLCVINCNISDEFLPICLPFFANMRFLDLSGNNITILPACIKNCGILRGLTLNDCMQLREIAAIPPSIQELWAINCYSLSSESTSILLTEELHKSGYQFCVPVERIPEWFNHSRSGPSISFWFRNKWQAISLGLNVPAEHVNLTSLLVDVMINGQEIYRSINSKHKIFGTRDHMFVMEISQYQVRLFIEDGRWNHVKICAHIGDWDRNPLAIRPDFEIKEIGIHVNKQQSNINDIRFSDPYNRKGKSDDPSSSKVSSTCLSHEDSLSYGYHNEVPEISGNDVDSDGTGTEDSEMSEASESSCDDVNSDDICNIKDARFANPFNRKRKLDYTLDLDDQSSSKFLSTCSSHKDLQQQHITWQVPESSENVRNSKKEDIVVYKRRK